MIGRFSKVAAVGATLFCLATCCIAAEFSADQVTKVQGITITGKLFRQGDKTRQENEVGSTKQILILRPDKKVMWMLDPKSKTYFEMPIAPKAVNQPMLKNEAELKKLGTKKELGKEKVNGFLCEKFRFTFKDKRMGSSTIWISKQLDWPIKTVSETSVGTVVTETKNIKISRQPSSLFEIPKGYKKVKMPTMPNGSALPNPGEKTVPKKSR